MLRLSEETDTGRNEDVRRQLKLWELDHRMYFYLNWPNGDEQGRHPPDDHLRIEELLTELKASGENVQNQVPAPIRFLEPSAQTQTQAQASSKGGHQNQQLHNFDDNSKIRGLVESFIVTDMSGIQPIETIFGNDEVIAILRAVLSIWVRPQPSQTSSSSPRASQYSSEILDKRQFMPRQSGSILLHGPNGTGKTSLCKSAVKESGRKLLQLMCNDLCSKLAGDTEKILATTFMVAKELAPSAIFIDEIDKVVGGGTHRDNFMARLEGVLRIMWSKCITEGWDVVVLGATSDLQDVPKGILSRFTATVKVGLLSFTETMKMLETKLTFQHELTPKQLRQIAADLAPLGPRAITNYVTFVTDLLRNRLGKATHFKEVCDEQSTMSDGGKSKIWIPCDVNDRGCEATTFRKLTEEDEPVAGGIASVYDCLLALKFVTGDMEKRFLA
ncbi:MAG: hypothetical protein Q9196_003061 [Gyalolechia fulgens]